MMAAPACTWSLALAICLALLSPAGAQVTVPEGKEGVTRPPAGTPSVEPKAKEGGSKSTAPT